MTTRRQSTARAVLAAVVWLTAALGLGACASGGTDGRSPDPPAPPPARVEPAPPGPAGPELQAPALAPVEGPCAAGPGYDCFTLRVPLDRTGRTPEVSGRIGLRVAVQSGARPPKGYLVVLAGGPGQAGIPLAQRLRERLGPAAPGYGLVVLDQRGTGPGALDCPGLQRSVGASDVVVPARGTVEECARQVGSRREVFTTADTVADLEDLREALGARRLALAGVSYGTFVAEHYALEHPDRVRALVLDSVVPQQGPRVLLVSSMAATPRVLRAVCRRTRCKGDPGADLRAALAFGANDVALLDTLVTLSVGTPRLDPLPGALHAAAHGHLGSLERLAARARAADQVDDPAVFSAGLHAATLCAEADVPWKDATAVPADREQGLAQAGAQLTPGRLGGFEPTTAVDNGLADTCRRWPPLSAPVPPASGSLPAVPTLLLAGELDLSTPLEDARTQLERAPRGRLVVVPGAGHSLLTRDRTGCALRATGRLLAGRPVPSCGR